MNKQEREKLKSDVKPISIEMYDMPEDMPIKDFIEKLTGIVKENNITDPVVNFEAEQDCPGNLYINGFVEKTEKEKERDKKKIKDIKALEKKKKEEIKQREIEQMQRIENKHGFKIDE